MSARIPEEVQAAMLYEIMNQVMRSRQDNEEEQDDNRVQCPVCSKFHEPREGEEGAAKKGEPASHGCLVIYIAHQCPICLEDPAGPPMIALPCGHLVCQPDFEKLGGFIGEKPSDKPSEDRRRANNNRNEGNGMDPDEFISGLSMMRMMGGVIGFPPGFMGDDDEDDEEEEEESDDESCPPLERVGGGPVEDDSDDDDSSMPPLEPIHGAPGNANNSDNDLMPPLENMRNVVENDNEEDSETSSMPALLPRDRAELDEEEKNDSIGDCPPLERADLDSSDDEEDDDSTPPPSGDDDSQVAAGDISEFDSGEEGEEDGEEIPFPALQHVSGASRAPTTFTRDDYLALPESERNFKTGGAWIMIPSDHNEDYSTLVYTNDVKCVHIGVFARESRLLVNDKKSILVISPKDGDSSNQSDVWHVTLDENLRKYEVPTNAQCVSDGDGGIWALIPTGGTKELSFYNADSPSGSVVNMLPESSYLVMDPMGGVWAHVRKRGTAEMEPGLYFYAIGAGHSLISSIAQDAKCTTGADGVCVLTTTGDKVQLRNIVLGENAQPVTLKNVATSKDIRVIPREKEEGERALYVHCRVKNRWKLCLLDESDHLSEICDCPKDARVVGDGKGGAWIFKRTGASHQMRMLTFVSSTGTTRDHGLSFPPGCKIAGL